MAEGGGGVLRELLAVFNFEVDSKELKKAKGELEDLSEKLKDFAEKVAKAFAFEQVYEFAESQARAMNAIERTAKQLGITTDRVQEFRFAAKSMGMDADELTNAIGRMQVSQQHAAQGSRMQAHAFAALGVHVRDANGKFKSADELMLDVADGIKRIGDPTKQAAAAVEIFGRSGRTLLPFLKDGRAGAQEYFRMYRELGGGYTKEAIEAGKDFDRQQAKTGLVLTSIASLISESLLPVFTYLSSLLQRAGMWFRQVAKDSHLVQVALAALGAYGVVFAAQMVVAFAPIIAAAAGIAALILYFEDLYTFLTGGESEIGEIIDKVFGKGAQQEVLKDIKQAWKDIAGFVHDFADGWRDAWQYVKPVWEAMKWMRENVVDLGDKLGRADVMRATEEGSKYNKAFYNKDVVIKQTQRYVAAQARGEKFVPTEIPAGMDPDVFLNTVKNLAPAVRRGDFSSKRDQQMESQYFGPLAPGQFNAAQPVLPGQVGSYKGGDNVVNVNVTTPPGLDERQVGAHVAKHVGEVLKQERRTAKATVARAGSGG